MCQQFLIEKGRKELERAKYRALFIKTGVLKGWVLPENEFYHYERSPGQTCAAAEWENVLCRAESARKKAPFGTGQSA